MYTDYEQRLSAGITVRRNGALGKHLSGEMRSKEYSPQVCSCPATQNSLLMESWINKLKYSKNTVFERGFVQASTSD